MADFENILNDLKDRFEQSPWLLPALGGAAVGVFFIAKKSGVTTGGIFPAEVTTDNVSQDQSQGDTTQVDSENAQRLAQLENAISDIQNQFAGSIGDLGSAFNDLAKSQSGIIDQVNAALGDTINQVNSALGSLNYGSLGYQDYAYTPVQYQEPAYQNYSVPDYSIGYDTPVQTGGYNQSSTPKVKAPEVAKSGGITGTNFGYVAPVQPTPKVKAPEVTKIGGITGKPAPSYNPVPTFTAPKPMPSPVPSYTPKPPSQTPIVKITGGSGYTSPVPKPTPSPVPSYTPSKPAPTSGKPPVLSGYGPQ